MVAWHQVESEAHEFAESVLRRFEIGINKTIATLRRDGSPRISATELAFNDGEVTLNMMPGSVKLRDVRRDRRVAIHSPTVEVPAEEATSWLGDAKMAGLLVEVAAPAQDAEPGRGYFRLDIDEVVLAHLDVPADEFVVESWHEGRGLERRRAGVS